MNTEQQVKSINSKMTRLHQKVDFLQETFNEAAFERNNRWILVDEVIPLLGISTSRVEARRKLKEIIETFGVKIRTKGLSPVWYWLPDVLAYQKIQLEALTINMDVIKPDSLMKEGVCSS